MNKQDVVPRVFTEIPDEIYKQLPSLKGVTLYHSKIWHNFLHRAFAWRVSALIGMKNNKEIKYFLPYVSKYRISSKVRIALPFSHQMGLATAAGYSPSSLTFPDVMTPLEIHDRVEVSSGEYREQYYLSILDLNQFDSLEEVFSSFNKSSIQRKIIKAEKLPFKLTIGTDPTDLESFSRLQSLTRWRQGSPTYPSKFFQIMGEELSREGHMQLYLLKMGNLPVSGIVFLFFGNKAIYGYGASNNDRSIWQKGVNQLVMWEAIQDAYNRGCRLVDLGRTPIGHTSLLEYKEKWGATSSIMAYTYANLKRSTPMNLQGGGVVNLASWVLRHLPHPLFRYLSPIFLRLAI